MKLDVRHWLMKKVVEKFKNNNQDKKYFKKSYQKKIYLNLIQIKALNENNQKLT